MPEENNLLTQIGLSVKEAEIYQILLKLGQIPAKEVLPNTSLKRTTVYSILEELEKKGLVERKEESNSISLFRAKHPYALKEYLDNKVSDIKTAGNKLDAVLPDFVNIFNEKQNKPGIRYLEGVEGFKKLYLDILETKSNLKIFTSSHDKTSSDMEKIINQNILKQKKLGITTQAILVKDHDMSEKTVENLVRQGVEARISNDNRFAIPSQIIIYANKVAITSLKNEIVTTLIENENISISFKNIFDYVWDSLKKL